MKNIIIGKNSAITNHLKRILPNSKAISVREKDFESKIKKIANSLFLHEKVNIIFNNFYPSRKISSVNEKDYWEFANLSLIKTINVLNSFNKSKINKIIYNSSSSVYGIKTEDLNDSFNRKFSSSFKFVNENLIYNFSKKNKIEFKILRIFNMYNGLSDEFSILGKIFKSLKTKETLSISNKGQSLRDFIHIYDVVKIIHLFLKKKTKHEIYDVGTGYGIKIKDILEYLKLPKKQIKYNSYNDEVGNSISNNSNIITELNYKKFIQLDKLIKKKTNKNIKGNLKKYKYKDISNENLYTNDYIIYGAGNVGKQVYDQLVQNKERIIYFVDDNPYLIGKSYKGIKIISLKDLKKISVEKELGPIIISIANLERKKLDILKNKLKNLSSNVLYLPTKKELISEKISLNDAFSSGLEDVIGRREIVIKKNNRSIKNKNILVTGAGGSIGSELCRQLVFLGARKIIALDNSEIALFQLKNSNLKNVKCNLCDIREKDRISKIIQQNKVNHIFHAAAYKHVNILENNISSAINNNILGTIYMLDNSIKHNCSFTLISTDKAVNPKSVLGISKRICEIIAIYKRRFNTKIKINIVRFGNVFGSIGSAVPKFIDQINNNQIITITNVNAKRYFMTIKEACGLVIETINLPLVNKSFILNMGKQIKILDIIKYLVNLKKINNPEYKYKIKEIGLTKGEKISEELISKKEKLKKVNKNIYTIKETTYNNKNIEKFISEIYKYQTTDKPKNSLKFLKKFLNNY